MTRDEALGELDQLIAEANHRNCFGPDSHTVLKLRVAQQIAIKEAQMFDENTPSDAEEYEAEHAGQRCRDAAAINKEHGR